MTAPTHIITGLASVVIVGHATGITPNAPSLLAMLVGTLAPDIDGNGPDQSHCAEHPKIS